jgi:hypothetical protein
MTLQEAISNLKIHQQWRLGADIIMIEPKELTESIDIVLSQLPQKEISDEEIEEQSWGYREVTKDMEIPPNEDWSNGAKWYREQLKKKQ